MRVGSYCLARDFRVNSSREGGLAGEKLEQKLLIKKCCSFLLKESKINGKNI